jgi:hypothetical protein
MTLLPSLPISLIALGALGLLALANWYVSGFAVERGLGQKPGEDRVNDFRRLGEDNHGDGFKKVA